MVGSRAGGEWGGVGNAISSHSRPLRAFNMKLETTLFRRNVGKYDPQLKSLPSHFDCLNIVRVLTHTEARRLKLKCVFAEKILEFFVL
jgi:hypothetical protein